MLEEGKSDSNPDICSGSSLITDLVMNPQSALRDKARLDISSMSAGSLCRGGI